MNPNSIEYNVIKFGLSKEEALNLIHERNKSPFYKINHKSEDEYRKFQSHHLFSEERKKEIQLKQNEGRKKWSGRKKRENLKTDLP